MEVIRSFECELEEDLRQSTMLISRRIQDYLKARAAEVRVKDVRIGLRYTAVSLEGGQTGVAFTFTEGMVRDLPTLKMLYPLAGRVASDLLSLLGSKSVIEMAVALATANALANYQRGELIGGDALEYLHIQGDDRVGMVGYSAPVLSKLRKVSPHIMIFEQSGERGRECYPEEDAYRFLPQCQVAMITSTSILNHTIDRLLESSCTCREVVLMGATTPLLRHAFEDTPVTLLSGVIVTKPEEILCTVSEGGGVRVFKKSVTKVNLPLAGC